LALERQTSTTKTRNQNKNKEQNIKSTVLAGDCQSEKATATFISLARSVKFESRALLSRFRRGGRLAFAKKNLAPLLACSHLTF
jgi:hypothetical protein